MKKTHKRLLALLLSLVLCIGLFPVTAFAKNVNGTYVNADFYDGVGLKVDATLIVKDKAGNTLETIKLGKVYRSGWTEKIKISDAYKDTYNLESLTSKNGLVTGFNADGTGCTFTYSAVGEENDTLTLTLFTKQETYDKQQSKATTLYIDRYLGLSHQDHFALNGYELSKHYQNDVEVIKDGKFVGEFAQYNEYTKGSKTYPLGHVGVLLDHVRTLEFDASEKKWSYGYIKDNSLVAMPVTDAGRLNAWYDTDATTYYTVTYKDGVDGTVFTDKEFSNKLYGDTTPSFGTDPVREDYVFAGWNPAVAATVTGNATYTATWEADSNNDGIPDKYQKTITFTTVNGTIDGGTSKSVTVTLKDASNNYSETGTANLTAPAVTADNGYTTTDCAWEPTFTGTIDKDSAPEYMFTCKADQAPEFEPIRISVSLEKIVEKGEGVTADVPAKDFEFEISLQENGDPIDIENTAGISLIGNTISTNGANTYTQALFVSVSSEDAYALIEDGFYLREKQEEAAGWTYSDAAYFISKGGQEEVVLASTPTAVNVALPNAWIWLVNDQLNGKASFTNTYNGTGETPDPDVPESVNTTITVNKVVEGDAPEDIEFSFQLKDAAGALIDTAKRTGAGTVDFASLTFDKNGVYTYTVEEVNDGKSGWSYDDSVITVIITVGLENNALAVTDVIFREGTTPLNGVSFTNTYKGETPDPFTPVTIRIPMQKIVKTNRTAPKTTFNFAIYAPGMTLTKGVDYTIEGASMDFDNDYDDVSWWMYITAKTPEALEALEGGFFIFEKNGGESGWTYDATEYYVRKETSGWTYCTIQGNRKTYSDIVSFTNTYKKNSSVTPPRDPVVTTDPDDLVPAAFSKDHYAYVIGYSDGGIHPEANITRAEVATIFFRLLADDVRDKYLTKYNSFSDVAPSAWYNTAVSTMAKMGVINGYPDGTFGPNNSITRAEFAAIAARFDPKGNKTGAFFTDTEGHWARKQIAIAANNGWVNGYPGGYFRPEQKITRAEAMTMVNRVLQRNPGSKNDLLPEMSTWFDNMDTAKWYYLAIQEASNSHFYQRKTNGTEYWTELRPARNWAALEK